jgi:hypothetical protein
MMYWCIYSANKRYTGNPNVDVSNTTSDKPKFPEEQSDYHPCSSQRESCISEALSASSRAHGGQLQRPSIQKILILIHE